MYTYNVYTYTLYNFFHIHIIHIDTYILFGKNKMQLKSSNIVTGIFIAHTKHL